MFTGPTRDLISVMKKFKIFTRIGFREFRELTFFCHFLRELIPQNWKSLILTKINFLKVLQEVLEILSSRKWKSPLVVNYLTESNLDFTLKTTPKLFIRSKWTIETLGKGEKYVSFINFEHISLHFLVFLLMDLNR